MKHSTAKLEAQSALINDSDFLKAAVGRFLQLVIDNEFVEAIGASRYERNTERQGYRNGHYERQLKTRVGSIELRVPRDREGAFKTELFNRYQRSEKALVVAMTEMYLQGVSTRKVSAIVEELCGQSISKSQVSELTKELDEELELWRNRSITKEYAYLFFDAIYHKVREAGKVEPAAAFVAIGITTDGVREIIGCHVAKSEHKTEWKAFLRSLKARGLKNALHVCSDDHEGLKQAIQEELTGTIWQRCQVHYMRNFTAKLNVKHRGEMVPLLQEVLHAADMDLAKKAKKVLIDRLIERRLDGVAEWIEETIDEALNVLAIRQDHRKKIRSTNMLERFNEEIRRRTRVVRIFPNRESCARLITAICVETSESWEGRCYLKFEETE